MKKYEKITYPDRNQMAYQVKKDLEDTRRQHDEAGLTWHPHGHGRVHGGACPCSPRGNSLSPSASKHNRP